MFFNCKIKEIQGRDKGKQYENKGIYNNICFAMNESGEKMEYETNSPPLPLLFLRSGFLCFYFVILRETSME